MGVLVKNGKSYTGTGDLLIQPVIYSDDERCIGVWRDGKPLYKKTFLLSSRTLVDNAWRTVLPSSSISDLNIEYIITCDAYDNNGDSNPLNNFVCTYPLATVINSNGILAYFNSVTKITALTLTYTKTTDTAGTAAWVPTGATPIHYSLNEQVIGTWIDGKPLYQKTIQLESQLTVSNSSWTSTNISDPGISTIAQCFGCDKNDHTYYPMCAIASDNVIKLWASRPGSNAYVTHFTIQYTKTTD